MLVRSLALFLLTTTSAWAGDKDKDGVDNKTDQCKEDPEDIDGFEDDDGCPDPDNDKDGLLDDQDKCKDKPEDKDGFEDEDGCPDPDNDKDGVKDADDKCGDEVENDDDGDGCPTVGYELLNNNGWVPAVAELTKGLLGALEKKGEGCDEVSSTGDAWLGKYNPDTLFTVYQARLARAPDGFDPKTIQKAVDAQIGVWAPVKQSFDIYCKEHGQWPGISAKLDAVFTKAKGEEKKEK